MRLRTAAIALIAPLMTLAQEPAPECRQRRAEDYVPMARTERLAEYLGGIASPQSFTYAAVTAGIGQWMDRPHEWGQGGIGYGRRYGASIAHNIIGTTLQHGFALGLDEDNRYFASGAPGFWQRMAYAL